jgi:Tfp pilus assembly protein PilO
MQQHRIISLLSILVMIIIPAIGLFLVAQPQLNAASLADQQRAETDAQITASRAVVEQLKVDSANLPALEAQLNELRTSIPADIDPSGYIDGLSALAHIAGVKITNLTVDAPVAYVPAVPPLDANAPVAPTPDPSADPSAAPAETPPPVAYPGIVTNPLVDSSNFVAIPVTIQVNGKLTEILKFVNGLQTNDRLFLVSALTTEPGAEVGSAMVGKIGGFIYAIPTGVEGNPRPVSTIVKQLDGKKPDPVETDVPDPGSTETPDPGSTDSPDAP